jgi:hypothetical protein
MLICSAKYAIIDCAEMNVANFTVRLLRLVGMSGRIGLETYRGLLFNYLDPIYRSSLDRLVARRLYAEGVEH